MTSEHAFLYVSLIVYMAVNMYTDFTKLKTKNVWHLIFFVVIGIYSVWKEQLGFTLSLSVIGFFLGYLLGRIPGTTLGAGDTKMLMVVFPYLGMLYGGYDQALMIFLAIYLLVSLLITMVCRRIQKTMQKKEIKYGTYTITKHNIETPEAVPMFIACLILPLLN